MGAVPKSVCIVVRVCGYMHVMTRHQFEEYGGNQLVGAANISRLVECDRPWIEICQTLPGRQKGTT